MNKQLLIKMMALVLFVATGLPVCAMMSREEMIERGRESLRRDASGRPSSAPRALGGRLQAPAPSAPEVARGGGVRGSQSGTPARAPQAARSEGRDRSRSPQPRTTPRPAAVVAMTEEVVRDAQPVVAVSADAGYGSESARPREELVLAREEEARVALDEAPRREAVVRPVGQSDDQWESTKKRIGVGTFVLLGAAGSIAGYGLPCYSVPLALTGLVLELAKDRPRTKKREEWDYSRRMMVTREEQAGETKGLTTLRWLAHAGAMTGLVTGALKLMSTTVKVAAPAAKEAAKTGLVARVLNWTGETAAKEVVKSSKPAIVAGVAVLAGTALAYGLVDRVFDRFNRVCTWCADKWQNPGTLLDWLPVAAATERAAVVDNQLPTNPLKTKTVNVKNRETGALEKEQRYVPNPSDENLLMLKTGFSAPIAKDRNGFLLRAHVPDQQGHINGDSWLPVVIGWSEDGKKIENMTALGLKNGNLVSYEVDRYSFDKKASRYNLNSSGGFFIIGCQIS